MCLELEKAQNLIFGPKTQRFPCPHTLRPLTEETLSFCTAQSLVGNALLMLLLVHSCPSFSHFSQPLSIYLFTPLPAVDFPQGWFCYLKVFLPFPFIWFLGLLGGFGGFFVWFFCCCCCFGSFGFLWFVVVVVFGFWGVLGLGGGFFCCPGINFPTYLMPMQSQELK